MARLARSFFGRDADIVAPELIGTLFVHDGAEGRTAVRLVEVEAYRGRLDPGSHGHRGPTPRTEVMYGPPGRLYVYFTYGMHWCANVVCGAAGVCEAVLLRAGEPVRGIDLMKERRPHSSERLLAAGPARLTQALGIDGSFDGDTLLRGGRVWLESDAGTAAYQEREVLRTTRIGLSAGKGDDIMWRWVVADSPYASRRS